jgi:hypothetical protein
MKQEDIKIVDEMLTDIENRAKREDERFTEKTIANDQRKMKAFFMLADGMPEVRKRLLCEMKDRLEFLLEIDPVELAKLVEDEKNYDTQATIADIQDKAPLPPEMFERLQKLCERDRPYVDRTVKLLEAFLAVRPTFLATLLERNGEVRRYPVEPATAAKAAPTNQTNEQCQPTTST